MFPEAKIAKKYLMHEPFKVEGFEYQFISVEPHEDWAIDIVVNVVLPKKVNHLLRKNLVMISITLSLVLGIIWGPMCHTMKKF